MAVDPEKVFLQDGVSYYLTSIFRGVTPSLIYGSHRYNLSHQALFDHLYESDGLVRKIVNLYPESAYNTGFEIESDDKEIYEGILNNLGVYETFLVASKVARLKGLSCVFIGFQDGVNLTQPANLNAPIELLKAYNIQPNTDLTTETIYIGGTEIHKSRLLFFKGHESYLETIEIKTVYQSVITCIYSFLCQYRQLPKQLSRLIDKSNQVALGTWGLSNALRQDVVTKTTTNRDLIEARGEAINIGRSINSTILYDKEHEVFDNISLALGGIPELCHEIKEHLALALDYPVEVIFGNSINSLGSGSVAQLVTRMLWATQLTQWIDNHWTRNLEYLVSSLESANNLREAKVKIPLALVLSPQEKAEINKNWSDILSAIYAVYPMQYKDVKEFMEVNFQEMFIPEEVPIKIEVPIQSDPNNQTEENIDNEINDGSGIIDYLSDLLRINGETIDDIMEKL
mgnify:CR=1 FL=1